MNKKTMKFSVNFLDSAENLNYKRIIWGGSHLYKFCIDDDFLPSDKDRDKMNSYFESVQEEHRATPCLIVWTDMNDKERYVYVEKYYV